MIRSTHTDKTQQPYKEFILTKYKERGDKWAQEVEHRVLGAVSDLHAVEARYHNDCMSNFFRNRSMQTIHYDDNGKPIETDDKAFHEVVKTMACNRERIWNSVELYQEYIGNAGTDSPFKTKSYI